MKKTKDLKVLTTEELGMLLAETQEKIRTIGFSEGITRQNNVKEGRPANKLVAQIKTELKRRAKAQ